MKYGIEIKVGDRWIPVRPPVNPPYAFATEGEAATMARVFFPELKRDDEGAVVRVSLADKEQP